MILLPLFLIAAETAPERPLLIREADDVYVITAEIQAEEAPLVAALADRDREEDRETRRAFEEAIDQARSARTD